MVNREPEVSPTTTSPSECSIEDDHRATLRPHVPAQVTSGKPSAFDHRSRQSLSSEHATTTNHLPQQPNHGGHTLSRLPWMSSRARGEKPHMAFVGGSSNEHIKSLRKKSQDHEVQHPQVHPTTATKGEARSNITTPSSPGASTSAQQPKRRKSRAMVQGLWSRLRTYPFLSATSSSSSIGKTRGLDPARAQTDTTVPTGVGAGVVDDDDDIEARPSLVQPDSPAPTFVESHSDPRLEPVGSLGQMVERAEMGREWTLGTASNTYTPGPRTTNKRNPTIIMSESPPQFDGTSLSLPPITPPAVTPTTSLSSKPLPAWSTSTASTPSSYQPPTTPYQILAPSSFASAVRSHHHARSWSMWRVSERPQRSGQSLLNAGSMTVAVAPSLCMAASSTGSSYCDDDGDRSVDVQDSLYGPVAPADEKVGGTASETPYQCNSERGEGHEFIMDHTDFRNSSTLRTDVWYANILAPLVPKPTGTRSIHAGQRSDEGVVHASHKLVRAVIDAHDASETEVNLGSQQQQPLAEVVSAEMLDSHLETKLQRVRTMEVDVQACVQHALAKHELDCDVSTFVSILKALY